jgi:hypothetical protein
MSWNTLRTAASLLALTIALPAVADAQIYVWRDASGNMVLSDRAKDPSAEVKTYAVAKTATFKTTNGTVSGRATKYDALIEESATFHGVDARTSFAPSFSRNQDSIRARPHASARWD